MTKWKRASPHTLPGFNPRTTTTTRMKLRLLSGFEGVACYLENYYMNKGTGFNPSETNMKLYLQAHYKLKLCKEFCEPFVQKYVIISLLIDSCICTHQLSSQKNCTLLSFSGQM